MSELPPAPTTPVTLAAPRSDAGGGQPALPEADEGPQRPEMVVFILFWMFYGLGIGLLIGWWVWG